MLYAELNPQGQFVRERNFPAQLAVIPRWIDGKQVKTMPEDPDGQAKWRQAPLAFGRIVLVETPLDPANYKPNGVRYRREGDGTVSKIMLVTPLSEEERAAYAVKNAKASREAALPDYDELIELLVGVVKIVVDRQLMTETPGDPRTRVSISQDGYNRLNDIAKALRANPLPNRKDIEKRTGNVRPDLKAETERDVAINVFNDRVNKILDNKEIQPAVKDAFAQLRKLIG